MESRVPRKRALEVRGSGEDHESGSSGSPERRLAAVETKRRRSVSPSTPPPPAGQDRSRLHSHYQDLRRRVAEDFGGWDPAEHTILTPFSAINVFGGKELTRQGFKITPTAALTAEGADATELTAKGEAVIAYGLQEMIKLFDSKDIGQVIIRNDNLHGNGFLSTKWTKFANLTFDDVISKFIEAKNSEDAKNDGLPIRLEDTEFQIIRFQPSASDTFGSKVRQKVGQRLGPLDKFRSNQRSTLNPFSFAKLGAKADHWCLILSCVCGEIRAENPGKPPAYYRKIYKRGGQLTERAEKIIQEAVLDSVGPHSIQDLGKIQRVLGSDYQICAYTDGKLPTYRFGEDSADKHIDLDLHPGEGEGQPGHAYLITDMAAYLHQGTGKPAKLFCHHCKQAYNKTRRHKCTKSSCRLCSHKDCKNEEKVQRWRNRKLCTACRQVFWSTQCLQTHQHFDKEQCKSSRKCGFCEKTLEKDHGCGLHYCNACYENHTFDQACYIKKPKANINAIRQRWYGDIESCVDSKGLHHPNLLVLKNANGKDPHRVFRGKDCIRDFVKATEHSDEEPSPFYNSYIVFHNLGGYDGHFIHKGFLDDGLDLDILRKGSSIMSLTHSGRKIVFRDSLRFIPGTPLSSFPCIFGFDTQKGHFPHKLNTRKHLDEAAFAEGTERFPPQPHFEPDKMWQKNKATFIKWWASEKARYDADPSLRYVVAEELERYCKLDVDVLCQGFELFIKDAKENHPTLDVLKSITSPSYCNSAFLIEDLEEETIALLPPDGFKPKGRGYSLDELAWLNWEKRQRGLVRLLHNRNFHSLYIGGKEMDGYGVDAKDKAYVFEYDGCYYHGCDCRKDQLKTDEDRDRADDLRLKTDYYHGRLKEIGSNPKSPYGLFQLVTIKECEFHRLMLKDREMREHVAAFKASVTIDSAEGTRSGKAALADPLSLSKSFFGGRTTPIMHRCDAEEGQTIGYADFTSLYPAVNACTREGEEYPEGYPTILLGIEVTQCFGKDLTRAILDKKLFGVLHCQLYPPKKLRHPVIPVRVKEKLLFPLCRTCAEEENQESCGHSEAERMLTVHLPSPEVRKALQVGYRLGSVYEAWHFDKRSSLLLRGYIVKHYKDKEYATGFPDSAKTAEQKRQHAKACQDALFGEPFEVDKFEKNSGKRTLYKGMLNNFWGFFGKREDHETCVTIKDLKSFKDLLFDDKKVITFVDTTPDGTKLLVDWKPKEEKAGKKVSRLIASFTTSLARLRLYQVLEEYSEQIIYMDTDSVFFFKSPSRPGPRMPGTLGELKDEILASYPPGSYIAQMSCTGPKSYIYVVCDSDGKVIDVQTRLKGITLTAGNQHHVTTDVLRSLQDQPGKLLKLQQMTFDKDKRRHTITTRDYEKALRYISTKRRHISNSPRLDTLPYGYVD